MEKKLLTMAIAAALAAPAAMADVTVYGQMHYSYDYVDAVESEGATGVSRETRIGFKGAEDLGGGLKGVWQIESAVDNANDKYKFRNTFVGLSGGFGTVLAGRHDTPYKLATSNLDFFTDRAADYNNLIGTISVPTVTVRAGGSATNAADLVATPVGYTVADERAPQTIAYVTPNLSGFSAAFAYVDHYFTETTAVSTTNSLYTLVDGDENDTAYSGMLMYDNAGFFASAAYEYGEGNNLIGVLAGSAFLTNLKTTAATAGLSDGLVATNVSASRIKIDKPNSESYKFGLGYTFGGTSIAAIYENIEVSADSATFYAANGAVITETSDLGDIDRDAYYIAAQHVFGNNVIKGYYGNAGDIGDVDDSGADLWAVGYDYKFSKRTTLYALYTQVANDDLGGYTANSGQGVGSAYSNPGDDVNVFSLGVIHKF